MKYLRHGFVLFLTLSSFGCAVAGGIAFAVGTSSPRCPDPPSVAGMVTKIEGQPGQLSDCRMSVQGTYAPEVEIIGPKYGGDCWVVAGLPLDTLTEAVSTALANAGLVEFVDTRGGGIYLLQFEVKRQSLTHTHHHLGLGSYTATVVVSYSVSVSDLKSPIWKEEITGEHVVETGLAATPPNFGWRAQAHAIEGAVATNLRVLIRQLRELLLNKDCAADAGV